MGGIRNAYIIFVGEHQRRDHFGDASIDESVILKFNLHIIDMCQLDLAVSD
jgi:hypothetical protein